MRCDLEFLRDAKDSCRRDHRGLLGISPARADCGEGRRGILPGNPKSCWESYVCVLANDSVPAPRHLRQLEEMPSCGTPPKHMMYRFAHRSERLSTSSKAIGLAAALLVLFGCGYSVDSVVQPEARCSRVKSAPVKTDSLIRALRRRGFDVYRDTTTYCPPLIAEVISNIFFRGPHENIDRHDEILRVQGYLSCDIFKRPVPAHRNNLRLVKIYRVRQRDVEVVAANVSCQLWEPDDASRRRARRAALVAAIRSVLPR